jgi:hypothetical protein
MLSLNVVILNKESEANELKDCFSFSVGRFQDWVPHPCEARVGKHEPATAVSLLPHERKNLEPGAPSSQSEGGKARR